MTVVWYARRVARMSPGELVWRGHDLALRAAWRRHQVTPAQVRAGRPWRVPAPAVAPVFTATLPPGTAGRVPERARAAIIASADGLLQGRWDVLGLTRTDMVRPDWFVDPRSGRRYDPGAYAFGVPHRSPEQVGDIKQIWEPSRLQHLTVLAAAWYLTEEDTYAERVAEHLRCWWRENPFLSGVHWISGIELGIRLISMVWIRRLLDGWPGAGALFESEPLALAQLYWHQRYLAAFRSRGSSANNHVIAEAAGQLTAACAFGWFQRSGHWRRTAARVLERELARNTFASGLNAEMAAGYHCFVADLGMLAAVEAAVAGCPLSEATWRRLCAMADSGAALLDQQLRPPRFGDSDEGRALLLDAPAENRWPGMLALAAALFGRLPWWPDVPGDATSVLAGALLDRAGPRPPVPARPASRPWRFPDAGITVLRAGDLWCRLDAGPHGFGSIAAHAHADALSAEIRYAGTDVLADPGTYCYHGEPPWRTYFRSTIGHNTLEIAGVSQSAEGGPFLWTRHARSREVTVTPDRWVAEHDGYRVLDPPVTHRRTVTVTQPDGACGVEIEDEVLGGEHDVRLAFHLGPSVHVELDGCVAALSWPVRDGPGQGALGQGALGQGPVPGAARLELPATLRWSVHRGETDPVLGWYSPGLGRRVPASTLIGAGRAGPGLVLKTRLKFRTIDSSPQGDYFLQAVSWFASEAR